MTKQLCMTIAVLVYVATWLGLASAQEWPRSAIRIIVAFGAGGGADIMAVSLAKPCKTSSASRWSLKTALARVVP